MKLANKTAVVTGASRGIGKWIALGLAQEGANVACLATEAVNAEGTAEAVRAFGRQAIAVGCLVQNSAAVNAAFAHVEAALGPVDILVNNAGMTVPMPFLDMTEENWDQHVDTNMKSVFLCSQAAARRMRAHKHGGSIIHIGSIMGQNAIPGGLAYCGPKAAVNHMTRVMAIELARLNIRVNCVAPGYIRTDMVDELVVNGKLTYEALEKRTPQRRLGTGEDIAKAVVYVASDDAGFMTGQVLVIDGGWDAYGYL